MDHYSTLTLPPFSSIAAVNKAYKKLALKYHPDRNRGDVKTMEEAAEMFVNVKESHSFLGDIKLKEAYDEGRRRKGKQEEERGRRTEEMGKSRREMKEDLERREAEEVANRRGDRWMGEAAAGAAAARKEKELRRAGERMREGAAGAAGGKKRKAGATEEGRVAKCKWSRKKVQHTVHTLTSTLSPHGAIEEVTVTADNAATVVFVEAGAVAVAVEAHREDKAMRVTAAKGKAGAAVAESTSRPFPSSLLAGDFEDLAAMRRRREAGRARAVRNMARADRREAGEAEVSGDSEDEKEVDGGVCGTNGEGARTVEVVYKWKEGGEGSGRERLARAEQEVLKKLAQ